MTLRADRERIWHVVVIAVMVIQLVATHLIWGRRMQASPAARARIMALNSRELIVDPKLMRNSLFVIGSVIAAFVFAGGCACSPARSRCSVPPF